MITGCVCVCLFLCSYVRVCVCVIFVCACLSAVVLVSNDDLKQVAHCSLHQQVRQCSFLHQQATQATCVDVGTGRLRKH